MYDLVCMYDFSGQQTLTKVCKFDWTSYLWAVCNEVSFYYYFNKTEIIAEILCSPNQSENINGLQQQIDILTLDILSNPNCTFPIKSNFLIKSKHILLAL